LYSYYPNNSTLPSVYNPEGKEYKITNTSNLPSWAKFNEDDLKY